MLAVAVIRAAILLSALVAHGSCSQTTNRTHSSTDLATESSIHSLRNISASGTFSTSKTLHTTKREVNTEVRPFSTKKHDVGFYINHGLDSSSQSISSNPTSERLSSTLTHGASFSNRSTTLLAASSSTIQVVSISIVNATSRHLHTLVPSEHHGNLTRLVGASAFHPVNQTSATSTVVTSAPPGCPTVEYNTPSSVGGQRYGSEWLSSCQAIGESYLAANDSFGAQVQVFRTGALETYTSWTTWEYSSVWENTENGEVSTLCDGYPRFGGNGPLPADNETFTASTFVVKTGPVGRTPRFPSSCLAHGKTPTFTGQPPAECTSWPATICDSLWQEWSDKNTAFNNQVPFGCNISRTDIRKHVGCSTWIGLDDQQSVYCGTASKQFPCTIGAAQVQLFYWPVTTTNGNLCNRGTTLTPNVNGTRISRYTWWDSSQNASSTTTFVSPTVYLSLQSVFAHTVDVEGDSGEPIIFPRGALGDFIIGVPPASVSSIEGHVPGFQGSWQDELSYIIHNPNVSLTTTSTSYNFAYLSGPMPASAYFFGHGASWLSNMYWWSVESQYSDTIYRGPWDAESYMPTLSVPLELRNIHPDLASCDPDLYGIYDPPTALRAQTVIATPTAPGKHTSTPASPAPTASSVPLQTNSPGRPPVTIPHPGPSHSSPDSPNHSSQPSNGDPPAPIPQPGHPTQPSQGAQGPSPGTVPQPGADHLPHTAHSGESTAIVPIGSSTMTATRTVGTGQGGSEITQAIIGGQTLTQDGSAITIGSHTLSLGTGGIVVDGQTQTFAAPLGSPVATVSLDGSLLPAIASAVIGADGKPTTEAIVDGQTISQGGAAITIGSHTLSMGPSGIVVDGTQTITFVSSHPAGQVYATLSVNPSTTLTATETYFTGTDGQTTKEVIIDATTLTAGEPPRVVSGEVMGLLSDGELVINGTQTIQFTTDLPKNTNIVTTTTGTKGSQEKNSQTGASATASTTGAASLSVPLDGRRLLTTLAWSFATALAILFA